MWHWLQKLFRGLLGDGERVELASVAEGWEGVSTRIHTEKEILAQSLAMALDSARMGHWDLDLTNGSSRRSPKHDQIFGYAASKPEWDLRDFIIHVVPEDRERVAETLEKTTRSGDAFDIQCRIRWPDESTHWIVVRGQAYFNDQGQATRMAGVVLDVTEQKQAEQHFRAKLEEALGEARRQFAHEQRLLNALVNNIPEPIFFKDRQSRFIRANRAMANDVGLQDPQELVGKTDAELWDNAFGRQTLADEQRLMETGNPIINQEEKPILPGGRERWVLVTKMPLRDEAGSITGLFGVAWDITKQKQQEQELDAQRQAALNLAQDAEEARRRAERNEQALRRSEEKFRGLIELAPASVILVKASGEIVLVNTQTERLFGYAGQELTGQPVEILIPERFRAKHPDHRNRYLADPKLRQMGSGVELSGLHKDGYEFPIEVGLSPLWTEEGLLISAVVHDLTARKKAEAELRQLATELARSNAELSQFAYVASHDLQEPLRMVASYLELLSKRYQDKIDDKAARWIGFAVDAAGRMKQLINDLLEFSRVTTKGKPFAPVDCSQVFATALANLRQGIDESGALVTHGPLPTLLADATQLTQLFQNLIGNAIKYRGDRPPEVRVEAARNGAHWQFAVRDNGIGIDPQFAERIFVIFQRLHTRDEYPGTGIGLALCQKIVERHGGKIWVESKAGQGATFFFTLPLRETVPQAPGRE